MDLITLNQLLINNKDYIKGDSYNNSTIIESTYTNNIENTILNYNIEIKVLFCTICKTNLDRNNYLKHLKDKHFTIYKSYKESSKLEVLKTNIEELEFNDLAKLEDILKPNLFYFKELDLNLKGYKCIECNYININYKEVRIHFNTNHFNSNKSSKSKVNYIINQVPLQYIKGNNKNTKLYFIPKIPNISKKNTSTNLYINSNSSNSSIESITSKKSNSSKELDLKEDIIKDYLKENLEENKLNNNININNNRLLNSYIKKSNIYIFLKDKDRESLVNLVYNIKEEDKDLSVFNRIDYNKLEDIIIDCLLYIHSKITNISLGLRQKLNQNNSSNTRVFKDFIPLENKSTTKTYFTYYAKLLSFIIKVRYIKGKYKNTIGKERTYFDLVKNFTINLEAKEALKNIIPFNLDLIDLEDKELTKEKEEFYTYIIEFYISLLKDNTTLTLDNNTSLNNIVLSYFFITNLDINTKEIKNIDLIGKLTSYILYNSKLLTIGYFYFKELNNIKYTYNDFNDFLSTYLTNSSNNYFEFISILRPYLLALNKERESTNYIIKETSLNIIEYNTIEYSITKIKELFKNVYINLEDILLKKLLKITSIDSLDIDFNTINDNTFISNIDYYIIDTLELKYLKTNRPYFLTQLLTKGTYYNKTLLKDIKKDTKTLRFKDTNIEIFNTNINRFLEYLTLAIYLYSGGPLRGTELTTILYKNIETKTRSLIYNKEDNTFIISTNYRRIEQIYAIYCLI
ncbi:hypothetical protein BDY17DRAFT_310738 [Neohortaea acidophila]|uniref:Uncharacterized protein n=1 Tax=Neohortaea acidophila TaxID=245834 RepID=A0A6A6PRV4_9PEZI|nr:uncharacterized protein BDY17DRAFT_311760 [Neohortaea acidophila]XP_033588773.1 uncharacterized protein BDY17DRAFT_310738 [Neohortaea acidophila]KAF2480955.1 hypothetical protein BDY17DRAFT_311760 [Neohortaea acidophila]KAF2482203.1 hypothetical protein BDY17DRAFT_310738 [Neohortaea acidophila]